MAQGLVLVCRSLAAWLLISLLVALLPGLLSLPVYPAPRTVFLKPSSGAPGELGDIWKNCSVRRDPLKIVSVSIYPDPPKKGQRIAVDVTLNLEEKVTGGVVSAELQYGIITFFNFTWKLCDLMEIFHAPCPLKKGPLQIKFNETVPGFVPAGHYTGRGMAHDQNNTELLCIDVQFHL